MQQQFNSVKQLCIKHGGYRGILQLQALDERAARATAAVDVKGNMQRVERVMSRSLSLFYLVFCAGGFFMPKDENGMTKGFAFIEFVNQQVCGGLFCVAGVVWTQHAPARFRHISLHQPDDHVSTPTSTEVIFLLLTCSYPQQAAAAMEALNGKPLDKNHSFLVKPFTDIDRLAKQSDTYTPPPAKEFKAVVGDWAEWFQKGWFGHEPEEGMIRMGTNREGRMSLKQTGVGLAGGSRHHCAAWTHNWVQQNSQQGSALQGLMPGQMTGRMAVGS
jgi:hypothetical protein